MWRWTSLWALLTVSVVKGDTVKMVTALNPAGDQEQYLDRAYRLRAAEYFSNKQAAALSAEELASIMKQHLVEENATVARYSGQLGLTGHTLDFQILKVTGTNTTSTLNAVFAANNNSNNNLVLLGGYSSEKAAIEAAWAAKNKVPLVSPGAATLSIFQTRGVVNGTAYAFGLLSPTTQLGYSTMKLFYDKFKAGAFPGVSKLTVAVLYEDASHGRDYLAGVRDFALSVPSSEVELVYNTSFPLFKSSWNESQVQAQKKTLEDTVATLEREVGLGDGSANLLLIDAHSTDFIILQYFLSLEDVSFKGITYGARGADSVDLVALKSIVPVTNLASLEGLLTGLWWSPGSRLEASRRFVTAWRKHEIVLWTNDLEKKRLSDDNMFYYGEPSQQLEPSWFGAVAYEAFRVLVNALETSAGNGDLGAQSVAAEIKASKLTNSLLPSGVITFDNQTNIAANGFVFTQNHLTDSKGSDIRDYRDPSLSSDMIGVTSYVVSPPEESFKSFFEMPAFTTARSPCTSRDIVYNVSTCEPSTGLRKITFFYLDDDGVACPNPGVACFCNATGAPVSEKLVAAIDSPCEYVHPDSSTAKALYGIAGAGMSLCFIALVLVLAKINSKVWLDSKRFFVVLEALAGMLACASLITFVGENTSGTCTARVVTLVLGVSALTCLLYGKVHYWYALWATPTVETLRMPWFKLVGTPLAVFVLICIVLSIWLGTLDESGLAVSANVVKSFASYSVQECSYLNDPGYPASIGVCVVALVIFSTILSYQSRSADLRFGETVYLFYGSFNTVLCLVVLGAVFALVNLDSTTSYYTAMAVCVFLISVGIVFCATWPRLSVVYGIRNGNVKTVSQEADGTVAELKFIQGRKVKISNSSQPSSGPASNVRNATRDETREETKDRTEDELELSEAETRF